MQIIVCPRDCTNKNNGKCGVTRYKKNVIGNFFIFLYKLRFKKEMLGNIYRNNKNSCGLYSKKVIVFVSYYFNLA